MIIQLQSQHLTILELKQEFGFPSAVDLWFLWMMR